MDISALKEIIHTFKSIGDAKLGQAESNFNEPFSQDLVP